MVKENSADLESYIIFFERQALTIYLVSYTENKKTTHISEKPSALVSLLLRSNLLQTTK